MEAYIIVGIIFAITGSVAAIFRYKKINKQLEYISSDKIGKVLLTIKVMTVDKVKYFALVFTNADENEIEIQDVYMEIKKNNRFVKTEIDTLSFDKDKKLKIPSAKPELVLADLEDFIQTFDEFGAVDTLFRIAYKEADKIYKTENLLVTTKKKIVKEGS